MNARRLISNRSLLSTFYTSKRLIATKNDCKAANEGEFGKGPAPAKSEQKITSEFILNKFSSAKSQIADSTSAKALASKETLDDGFDGFTKKNPLPAAVTSHREDHFQKIGMERGSFKNLSPEKKRKIIEYNWALNRENGNDLPEEIDEKSLSILMDCESYMHLLNTLK